MGLFNLKVALVVVVVVSVTEFVLSLDSTDFPGRGSVADFLKGPNSDPDPDSTPIPGSGLSNFNV